MLLGPTGSGKTSWAWRQYPNLWDYPMQAKGKLFFHGLPYDCRCILFDEFENTCRAEELNRLLEWHPLRTEFKGN